MIVLRQQQIDLLCENSQSRFEERLIRHVAENFPDETKPLGEPGIRAKVKTCVRLARTCGIRSEMGIALYTDARIALGTQEPSVVPGAEAALEDDELDGDTKAR